MFLCLDLVGRKSIDGGIRRYFPRISKITFDSSMNNFCRFENIIKDDNEDNWYAKDDGDDKDKD